jgi:tyrosinase
MTALDDLQARADALLTKTESSASIAAKVASTEGPTRRFSTFIPSELERSIELAGELMAIAAKKDVGAALEEAERRTATEDVALVRHAVEMFIVHDPEAARLAIPPIPQPDAKRAAARLTGALGPEAALDWFREDPLANDHHRHWHIVYPARGRPTPGGGAALQDRQGELFFYMHQQMLARYDAERRGLGFDPVEPFADYRAPIEEGYEDRPSGQALRDVERDDTGLLRIADLEGQRDRLHAAVLAASVENGGGPAPLTSELLGALEEPTAGTLWRDVWHHGFGHVITAFVMAPRGGGEPGDIGDTATAIRDPFFWRWHRHIDDQNFALQEQAAPFAFDDAPQGVTVAGVEVAFEADPGTPVEALLTLVAETDDVAHGDHEPFLWRLNVESAEERKTTVRIFLAPAAAADDRRAWIEMDKFEHVLAPGTNAIERPGRLASPVRKPAERPPVLVQGPANTPHAQYCRCGWPYHLLLPRGTVAGMPFRVLVMLTDWELDRVAGDDDCGSMSFCGARDRYPDQREMGYPFSRPIPGGIAATLEALPSVHARDLTIRHDPRPVT